MQKNYSVISISDIPPNWDHYDPEIPSTHFPTPFLHIHSTSKKKKFFIILEYLYTFRSAVSFVLTCLLIFRSTVSVAIWYLYSKQSPLQNLGTCISPQFPLQTSTTCILLPYQSSLTIIFYSQKREMIFNKIQREMLQIPCANRICNWRKAITSFPHTLHFIVLFLSSDFFLYHSI